MVGLVTERRWLFGGTQIAAPFSMSHYYSQVPGYVSAPELWGTRVGLSSWASLVDLGAVIYAAIAVMAERGVKVVFWALDERRKWRERWRAEAQAEGLAKGRAEGRVEGIAEGRVEGRAEGRAEAFTDLLEVVRAEEISDIEELIARIAKEKGIPLNGDSKG